MTPTDCVQSYRSHRCRPAGADFLLLALFAGWAATVQAADPAPAVTPPKPVVLQPATVMAPPPPVPEATDAAPSPAAKGGKAKKAVKPAKPAKAVAKPKPGKAAVASKPRNKQR
jgi:hypothetical protein